MSAQRILASGAAALLVLIVLAIATHGDGSGSRRSADDVPAAAAGRLRAHVAAGQLTLDGPVRDADEKKAIEDAAGRRFGKDNVLSRLAGACDCRLRGMARDVMRGAPAQGCRLRGDRRRPRPRPRSP